VLNELEPRSAGAEHISRNQVWQYQLAPISDLLA